MPLGGAAGFKGTYEGQQNVLIGGVRVMLGALRLLKVVSQKASAAVEEHVTMQVQPGPAWTTV